MLVTLLMIFGTSLGFLQTQEPEAELVAALDRPEPGDRRLAAEGLAAMGPDLEKWLERNLGRGSELRQRGVLLSAALLGTEESLALVERAARRGRKADPQRAYALMLYGTYHPQAGRDLKQDLKRAASDFEKACLMAGYLAGAPQLDVGELRDVLGKKATARQRALLGLLAARVGQAGQLTPGDLFQDSALVLVSLLPGQDPVNEQLLARVREQTPEVWQLAARRSPGRTFDDLKGRSFGGDGAAAALALAELPRSDQQAAFEFLLARIVHEPQASWLWGLAGDLGLELPVQTGKELAQAELAGLIRFALLDFERAQLLARARAIEVRAELAKLEPSEPLRVHSALLLALAGEEVDRPWFKQRLQGATASERAILQPMWLLAAGQIQSVAAREAFLMGWSQRLNAGRSGFLRAEGRRFVALALTSGSLAASELPQMSTFTTGYEVELDHPSTDEIYNDIVEFLNSQHYVWGFEAL